MEKVVEKKIEIINTDLNDLKAKILQDDTIRKSTVGGIDPKLLNNPILTLLMKK